MPPPAPPPRTRDITNQTFGSWTVLSYVPGSGGGGRHSRWLCRCVCGTEREVSGSILRTGATLSCGRGACNWRWRGDDVGYTGAHYRVVKIRGLAESHRCADCGSPAAEWSYDHGDPDERTEIRSGAGLLYSTNPTYYVPRCALCHRHLDRKKRSDA